MRDAAPAGLARDQSTIAARRRSRPRSVRVSRCPRRRKQDYFSSPAKSHFSNSEWGIARQFISDCRLACRQWHQNKHPIDRPAPGANSLGEPARDGTHKNVADNETPSREFHSRRSWQSWKKLQEILARLRHSRFESF